MSWFGSPSPAFTLLQSRCEELTNANLDLSDELDEKNTEIARLKAQLEYLREVVDHLRADAEDYRSIVRDLKAELAPTRPHSP